jgi:hypothetical protein
MRRSAARKVRRVRKRKTILNRKSKKVLLRVGLVSLLFIFSALFLVGLTTLSYLKKSFVSALSPSSSVSILEDQLTTTAYVVVNRLDREGVVIEKADFLVFDKNNKKILSYNLPLGTPFNMPGSYGPENLSKAIMVGTLKNGSTLLDGMSYLRDVYTKIFGFKIDSFILVDKANSALFDDLLGNGSYLDILRFREMADMRGHMLTDLTLNEFYSLFSFIKSLPNERIIYKNLTVGDLDDSSVIDSELGDLTSEYELAKEGKSVSVLNGTEIPGMAIIGSRIIGNLGGRVVAVDNTKQTYSNSMIVSDDVSSFTTKTLSRVFGITNVIKKGDKNVFENEVDRSDVVVIIGFDTSYKLY